MTSTSTSTDSAEVSGSGAGTSRFGGSRRLLGSWWVLVGAAVVSIAVAALVAGGPRTSTDLDPDNPNPQGARALARVLADQGVEVSVVRSAARLEDAAPDSRTTVLVTSADDLGPSTASRLRAIVADSRLVLAVPAPPTTDLFDFEPGSVVLDVEQPADCVGADLVDELEGFKISIQQGLAYPAREGCFSAGPGALVAQPEPGVLLVGSADLLRNEAITEADNAAVALRLLGQRDRLVWYVPDLADLPADEAVSLSDLLPPWLRPGLWLGALTMIALIGWRGRRLGPLVVEPLPVTIKAIETTRSRGRLYRRANARAHAAATLRTSARASLAARLRLSVDTDPHALIRALAQQVERPIEQIGYLLHPTAPAPTTDHELITLATELAELDREARRR